MLQSQCETQIWAYLDGRISEWNFNVTFPLFLTKKIRNGDKVLYG